MSLQKLMIFVVCFTEVISKVEKSKKEFEGSTEYIKYLGVQKLKGENSQY